MVGPGDYNFKMLKHLQPSFTDIDTMLLGKDPSLNQTECQIRLTRAVEYRAIDSDKNYATLKV